jgi:hypothetical protein
VNHFWKMPRDPCGCESVPNGGLCGDSSHHVPTCFCADELTSFTGFLLQTRNAIVHCCDEKNGGISSSHLGRLCRIFNIAVPMKQGKVPDVVRGKLFHAFFIDPAPLLRPETDVPPDSIPAAHPGNANVPFVLDRSPLLDAWRVFRGMRLIWEAPQATTMNFEIHSNFFF